MESSTSQCSPPFAQGKSPLSVVSIRTHRGSGERLVSLSDLKNVAHLSQEKAAAALNVGNTRFKSACRELGMKGWPYRKIKSVRNLQLTVEENLGVEAASDILLALENLVELHFHNPTLPLDDTFKVMRQAAYKKKHGQKRARAAELPWSERQRRGPGAEACCLASDGDAAAWQQPCSSSSGPPSPRDGLAAGMSPPTPQDRTDAQAPLWARQFDDEQRLHRTGSAAQPSPSLTPLQLTPLALPLGLPIPEVSPGLFSRLLEQEPLPLEALLEDSCDSS